MKTIKTLLILSFSLYFGHGFCQQTARELPKGSLTSEKLKLFKTTTDASFIRSYAFIYKAKSDDDITHYWVSLTDTEVHQHFEVQAGAKLLIKTYNNKLIELSTGTDYWSDYNGKTAGGYQIDSYSLNLVYSISEEDVELIMRDPIAKIRAEYNTKFQDFIVSKRKKSQNFSNSVSLIFKSDPKSPSEKLYEDF